MGFQDREEVEVEVCVACGTPLGADTDRAFGFGTENALCWGCATQRGGRYDAQRDVWEVEPDLSGLPDEAYGAAPREVRRR